MIRFPCHGEMTQGVSVHLQPSGRLMGSIGASAAPARVESPKRAGRPPATILNSNSICGTGKATQPKGSLQSSLWWGPREVASIFCCSNGSPCKPRQTNLSLLHWKLSSEAEYLSQKSWQWWAKRSKRPLSPQRTPLAQLGLFGVNSSTKTKSRVAHVRQETSVAG